VALCPGPEGQGQRGQRDAKRQHGAERQHAAECRAGDAAIRPGVDPTQRAGAGWFAHQRCAYPALGTHVRGTHIPGTRQRDAGAEPSPEHGDVGSNFGPRQRHVGTDLGAASQRHAGDEAIALR
jgi:hypothetical protein